MTKLLTFLATACLLLSPVAKASQTNLLNLQYVNGTNTGNTYLAPGIYIPPQKYLLQSLGITNQAGYSGSYLTNGVTNAIQYNVQISIDSLNSNWLTLASFTHSTTNAILDSFTPSFNAITLPLRVQVITTNALGVGVIQIQ